MRKENEKLSVKKVCNGKGEIQRERERERERERRWIKSEYKRSSIRRRGYEREKWCI